MWSEYALLVHRVCKSQLVAVQSKPFFCEVCNSTVGPDEIEEVDNSPGPFSG